uniref:Uncharacterized protein n=1 Tax=Anopheles maculatus TaxID=74869 RepID=A0A182SR18_9DIPT
MAKPFMLPESGPGGGSSSSGAGPPNNAPSNANTMGGNTAPSTPAPIGSSSVASVSGQSGAPGHVPSAPIPVSGANSPQQYHLQQLHHHHQQLQHHYQSYQGSHAALMGAPGSGIGGSLPVDPHLMLPMTPPASGFATAIQTPQMTPVNEQLVQALYEAIYRCSLGASELGGVKRIVQVVSNESELEHCLIRDVDEAVGRCLLSVVDAVRLDAD